MSRESKRSWNSRGAEHKPGTRSNNESAMRHHAETTDHDIHPDYLEIIERNLNNRQEGLFLEALHSVQDRNAVNEYIQFPQAYLPSAASLETSSKKEPIMHAVKLFQTNRLTKATESLPKI